MEEDRFDRDRLAGGRRDAAGGGHLKQHNVKDAKGEYRSNKILAYDGVHMLPRGNALLADYISRGIVEALKP